MTPHWYTPSPLSWLSLNAHLQWEGRPPPPYFHIIKSCLTLCDPMNCSPPSSSVYGILKARILEGLPFPSPGDLPHSGIKPGSPTLQANSLPTETPGKPKYSCEYAANSSFPCWDFLGFFFFQISRPTVGWIQTHNPQIWGMTVLIPPLL